MQGYRGQANWYHAIRHAAVHSSVIRDDTNNAVISDSLEIARYLDNQYPETIAMFPKGSQALQAAFKEAMSASPWPTFSR